MSLQYIFDLAGDFINKIYSIFKGTNDTKIAIIGLENAGKSTLWYRLKVGESGTTTPILLSIETVEYKHLNFIVFDVGASLDKLGGLWRQYFEAGAKALVCVIDSSDLERVDEARKSLMQVLEYDILGDATLLIYANKQDNPHALAVSQLADRLDLHSIKHRKWFIQPAIATQGVGLYEGLEWLSKSLKEKGSN
ncbi:hypothetical protein CYY_006740 [Polysphondylium violaceum]|uniref:ADP-ribosylation factor n=1 Tax=Polysphondylium violaceum TaxID=133409 RepID=A0A8J4PRT0_9MYCE|nr:hypothetical protein CYY_006740 [Polysphondylium violaceum]